MSQKKRGPEVVQVDDKDRRRVCDGCHRKSPLGYWTGLGVTDRPMGKLVSLIQMCPECAIYWAGSMLETAKRFKAQELSNVQRNGS